MHIMDQFFVFWKEHIKKNKENAEKIVSDLKEMEVKLQELQAICSTVTSASYTFKTGNVPDLGEPRPMDTTPDRPSKRTTGLTLSEDETPSKKRNKSS